MINELINLKDAPIHHTQNASPQMQCKYLVCVHVHVCVHTHVCRGARACVCTDVEVGGQPWVWLFSCCPPCFLETGSLTGLQLAEGGGLTQQRAPGVPHLRLSSTMPCFLMWVWRLNSSAQACMVASPLQTQPCLGPTRFCLLIRAFWCCEQA